MTQEERDAIDEQRDLHVPRQPELRPDPARAKDIPRRRARRRFVPLRFKIGLAMMWMSGAMVATGIIKILSGLGYPLS